MAGIFAKLLGSLFNKQRTTGRVVRVELAPVGYDPFKDPDGEQLRAAMGGRRFAPSLGNAGPWLSIAPWALAFLAVVTVAVWWYVLRPANVKEKMIAATATAVAAMPTYTPTLILVTETVRAERDRATKPAPTVTSTPTVVATPMPQKPTMTFTPPPTPTWTPPPTETPTFTPTWTTSPVQSPSTPAAPGSAQLAATTAKAGDSMVVTGQVANGSVVRLLWEDGKTLLGQGAPGLIGNFAIPFVVPGNITNGYHVVYVVWSAGKSDHVIPLVLSINVPPPPTPTWTPIPLPTFTPTWTPTPTVTPTPYPTPVGGWPVHVYFPVVAK